MGLEKQKLRLGILLMGIFIFFGTLISHGWAATAEKNVRIKLSLATGSVEINVQQGTYEVADGITNIPLTLLDQGSTWTLIKEGPNLKGIIQGNEMLLSGPLVIRPTGNTRESIFKVNNQAYRGGLWVWNENVPDNLLLVNVLGVESYLYGVVGPEMGSTAPLEALKAQAVVARSYALSSVTNPTAKYDLTADTFSQVYRGLSAEAEQVRQAVDATAGEAIFYDKNIIKAYFHSNAGGYTEASENVWSQPSPYLKPVSSPHDAYAAKQSGPGKWPAVTYEWEKILTREELLQRMNIGDEAGIYDLQVSRLQRDSAAETISGRVTRFDILGLGGQQIMKYERDNIRTILGTRSTLFENPKLDSEVFLQTARGKERRATLQGNAVVSSGGNVAVMESDMVSYTLRGAAVARDVPRIFQEVIIKGRGYGHGLGMSQWGARGMALDGYNYRQIIEHYYNQDKNDGHLIITAET